MPQSGDLQPCGPADADGYVRDRVQTNGRCEAAIERGDTYGPVSYEAYVPATALFGWSGKWDTLPAAHATSIAFDLLAVLVLVLVGLRFGGTRLAVAARVRVGGLPVHRVHAEREHERRDHARVPPPRLLAVDLRLGARRRRRALPAGRSSRRSSWPRSGRRTRRRASPRPRVRRRLRRRDGARLRDPRPEPSLWGAVRTFWDRTIEYQSARDSPFSIWGWGQYHARGIPDLGFLQPRRRGARGRARARASRSSRAARGRCSSPRSPPRCSWRSSSR